MDENEKLRTEISTNKEKEHSLSNELSDLKNKITNMDSKVISDWFICELG